MAVPLGPSMQIALGVADAFGCASCGLLLAAWERWLGPQAVAKKYARLEARCLLHRTTLPNLERVVRLTEEGRIVAAGGRNPEAWWGRATDGHWRFSMFDIPESERGLRLILRRTLRRLYFGRLQQSVWLSPDPIEVISRQLRDMRVDVGSLLFIDGRPCAGETDEDLARTAWNFDLINRRYDNYLEILQAVPRGGRQSARVEWLQAEWRAWLRAFQGDPLLPAPLLPKGYRGREAWERRNAVFARMLRQS